jgi:hypothetical protein
MRRLLGTVFGMALVLVQGVAYAAWTYMGHIDGHTVLIDRTTVELKGRNALVWMLTNYSSPTANQLLSATTHLEFDCDKNTVRYLQFYGYEGQMQSGARLISKTQSSVFVPVQIGTVMKSFQQIACTRGPFFRQEGVLNKPPK